MEHSLYIDIIFDINDDTYKINSDVKQEKIKDIISDFLSLQMGKGEDTSPANKLDEYNISLKIDLTEDIFTCSHNCGNDGLRDGILLNYIKKEK
jgi:hypothetical protein